MQTVTEKFKNAQNNKGEYFRSGIVKIESFKNC